jgi:hypothetical protein
MAKANTGAVVCDFGRSDIVPGRFIAAAGMYEGDLVGITATTGLVNLASADAGSLLENAVGVLTQDVLTGAICSIVDRCTIKGVSSMTVGARVWLSEDPPGSFTATRPTTAGSSAQCVGYAIDATTVRIRVMPVLLMQQDTNPSTVAFATTA